MSENRALKKEMYYDEAIRLHFELGYGEDRVAEILPIGHTTAWRWFRKFAAENKGKTPAMARTKKEKTTPKASDGEAKDVIHLPCMLQSEKFSQNHEKSLILADFLGWIKDVYLPFLPDLPFARGECRHLQCGKRFPMIPLAFHQLGLLLRISVGDPRSQRLLYEKAGSLRHRLLQIKYEKETFA